MRLRRSRISRLIAGSLLVVVALAVGISLLSSSGAPRPRFLDSMLQDDSHLLYASTASVSSTFDTLKALGVDTVRVTLQWSLVAPAPAAATPPSGFDARNPADYPARVWLRYDRVVELAHARGIGVDFDLTAPGPRWAMAPGAPSPGLADRWYASAADFGQFVTAVGRRYSGSYVPPGRAAALPRVDFWSIWNEPNQPGSLAPQWRDVAGSELMESPALYRAYAGTAFAALQRTGHGPSTDTILIGELAPAGCPADSPCAHPPYDSPLAPIPFLRALYCVNASDRPLTGAAATAVGCLVNGDASAFMAANPALFQETGFSEHPYSFSAAPGATDPDPNFVPLSGLARLEHSLDAIFGAYGVDRTLPLYLTQYGYETDPPNPFGGVSPQLQAVYLEEAAYMAWRDPRVHALAQLLLYDSPPDTRYPRGSRRYWSTLQTGLLSANGAPKPSLRAYQLPVVLPDPVLDSSRKVLIWAMLRTAPRNGARRAEVQWRPGSGGFRTVATVTTSNPNHVLAVSVRLPGPGVVRVGWTSPSGRRLYSLPVAVRDS